MTTLILLSLFTVVVHGHMGISSFNGITPRDKAVGDAYRYPNAGHCHGIPPGAVSATSFEAGKTYTLTLSAGAAHGGGQCSLFLAERSDQETKWYKQMDTKSCTLKPSFQWTINRNAVPLSCGTEGCTLIWVWTPLNSGTCEIYMNCFDIKITGTGGFTAIDKFTIKKNPVCSRPSPSTGLSTMFGDICLEGAGCGAAASPTATSTNTQPPSAAPPPTDLPAGVIPYRCGSSWLDANANCKSSCTAANEASKCTAPDKCFADMTRACSTLPPSAAPANANAPIYPVVSSLGCKAVGVWAAYAGMDAWCNKNCNDDSSTCPVTHCSCTKASGTAALGREEGIYEPTCQSITANGTESIKQIAVRYDLHSYYPNAVEEVAMKTAAEELLKFNVMCTPELKGSGISDALPSNTKVYLVGDCQLTGACKEPGSSGVIATSFSFWTLTVLAAWLF